MSTSVHSSTWSISRMLFILVLDGFICCPIIVTGARQQMIVNINNFFIVIYLFCGLINFSWLNVQFADYICKRFCIGSHGNSNLALLII